MQYNITLHDGTSIAQQGTIEGFIKQYPDTDADLGTPGNPDSGIDTTRQTTLFLPRLGTSHIGETTRYTTSAGTSGGGSGYIGSPDFPLELLDCSYGEFVRRDIIATGIRYLRRGAAGRLRIDADKRECSRVSCSNDGAIYACPDVSPPFLSLSPLAIRRRNIVSEANYPYFRTEPRAQSTSNGVRLRTFLRPSCCTSVLQVIRLSSQTQEDGLLGMITFPFTSCGQLVIASGISEEAVIPWA